MKLIELNIERIIALCKKYNVAKLWVFGSILTPRFNDESDVDLIVDFDESKVGLLEYADNFFGLIHALEALLSRRIDLTVDKSITNKYFREEVNEKRGLIWSAQ